MSSEHTFSLITEPWIRCEMHDGDDRELSLRDVFDGSHRPIAVRGESPTQDYAVLRLLLAIFWRAHRSEAVVDPGETFLFEEWFESAFADAAEGRADELVLEHLDQHADRFDLLHPTQPFMQVADLRTAKDTILSPSRIVPDAENDYFSLRAGSGRETLPLGEAARWLIHTHAFDYSGIKPGAVGDPRVKGGKGYPIGTGWSGMTGGTVALGRNLAETLVLNTPLMALTSGDSDKPVWEREPGTAAPRASGQPSGPADLATWQSRRIRLHHDGSTVHGVMVSNGDQIPDAGANLFGDPMTPYRFSRNKSSKAQDVFYPRPYDVGRTMWRSLEPLIALDGEVPLERGDKAGRRPESLSSLAALQAVGLLTSTDLLPIRMISASYGPQASTAATTIDARLDVPPALLADGSRVMRRMVLDSARRTLDAGVALGAYAGQVLVAAGGTYEFRPAHTDALLTELEPSFHRWIASLSPGSGQDPDADAEASAERWQREVRDRVLDRAQEILRGAGPKALIGREVTRNERVTLVTAGTAYGALRQKLATVLPALHRSPKTSTSPPTSIPENDPGSSTTDSSTPDEDEETTDGQ